MKRFGGKIGHVAKHSANKARQRAQEMKAIARMSPQRRRMLKVCIRKRRNRGTHRDEALRLCLPGSHKKKYGRRIGGVVRKVSKAVHRRAQHEATKRREAVARAKRAAENARRRAERKRKEEEKKKKQPSKIGKAAEKFDNFMTAYNKFLVPKKFGF